MYRNIHLLGDGLAGTCLANSLSTKGVPFRQYGDGNINTPPVAFVHLFQGRTFHRDPVEVDAFHKAIEFWDEEPLAKEWQVLRSVNPGDRLSRSADTETVPPKFRPVKVDGEHFRYAPGYTVGAQELSLRWRRESLADKKLLPKSEPTHLPEGVVVHATGLEIQRTFPDWRWDVNPGRTVNARVEGEPTFEPSYIYLHKGCHVGGNPTGGGLTLGGRVNSKGEAKNDEAEISSKLLGKTVKTGSEWWGKRIANALDRWPLIGWLDKRNFLFCGFGGRALFWLPYCTELALEALANGSNEGIPSRLKADRFR